MLLHIFHLLLLLVSLVIASTTAHVVVILVLPLLVVIIWAAVILLPWLLLIWLHHGLIIGPITAATHLSIHHVLRLWHTLHWGPEVARIVVHRGRLLCSLGFELLDAAGRDLEGRLEVCYSWVQECSIRRCLVATENTQKIINISVGRNELK